MQVTAKECRAHRLTKLDQSSVRGVLHIGAGETAQDVRRGRGAKSKCRRELYHLVVLATDQVPTNRPRQHGSESRVRIGFAGDRAIEPLGMDALEPWQKVEPEQVTEGEGHVALPMAVDVSFLNVHLGAMPQYALDHGRDFGG